MLPDNVITDNRKNLEKAYETMKHSHKSEKPTRLEIQQCERCKYDTSEKSLEDKIKTMETTDQIKRKNRILKFKELRVVRGRFDDVIGWSISWQ